MERGWGAAAPKALPRPLKKNKVIHHFGIKRKPMVDIYLKFIFTE